MSARCPACEAEARRNDPLAILAIGVALGVSRVDMHAVTEMMCSHHRMLYAMAMVRATAGLHEGSLA